MEIPQLLKRAINELDVNLEEELSRYQYWQKHGRAPSPALKFSQRTKPVLPPPLPEQHIKPPVPEPDMPEISNIPVIDRVEPELPPPTVVPRESWFDWQTGFATLVITILLGTVGYIAAEMLSIDRLLEQPPLNPPPQPQSQTPPPPVAVKPSLPTTPPVSVRPPLPDPTIENLPPVETTPPPGEPVLEEAQPIVVYKVVVDRQYLDRVQQIEPGAFIRPQDGTVQVAAFEKIEDAQRMIETLQAQDIPAQLE